MRAASDAMRNRWRRFEREMSVEDIEPVFPGGVTGVT